MYIEEGSQIALDRRRVRILHPTGREGGRPLFKRKGLGYVKNSCQTLSCPTPWSFKKKASFRLLLLERKDKGEGVIEWRNPRLRGQITPSSLIQLGLQKRDPRFQFESQPGSTMGISFFCYGSVAGGTGYRKMMGSGVRSNFYSDGKLSLALLRNYYTKSSFSLPTQRKERGFEELPFYQPMYGPQKDLSLLQLHTAFFSHFCTWPKKDVQDFPLGIGSEVIPDMKSSAERLLYRRTWIQR